jgi:hypothetical protein
MRIDALRGHVGMMALLRAFRDAGRAFELETMIAVPVEASQGDYHLLFTIGSTTAALSLTETRWFANELINVSGLTGDTAGDVERFGRMMLSVLAESPGPHGVH